MHQLLVFNNNSVVVFYTLYLIILLYSKNFVSCVSFNTNRNFNNTKFYPMINKQIKRDKLCTVPTDFLSLKPVQVSVNTYWGKESQFNNKILLKADLKDKCVDVKKFLFDKTGIPIEIQNLYVCKSDDFENCVKLNDNDVLSDHLRDFTVSPTKELELNLLLDLPAPVFKSVKPDVSKVGDYVASLTRYTELLNSDNEKSKKSKDSDYKNNVNSFIKESSKMNLSDLNKTKTTTSSSNNNNTSKGDSNKDNSTGTSSSNNTNSNNNNNNTNNQLTKHPNNRLSNMKRVYIRLFEDYPPNFYLFKDRYKNLLDTYLPIKFSSTLGFSLFCLMLSGQTNNKNVLRAIILLPAFALAAQTRFGNLVYRTFFHFLAKQSLPKFLYNILPATLAEKFRSG